VAVKRISSGGDAAFGFTEREGIIHFRQDGNFVKMSSSKRPVQASVGAKSS
jgi:hypothetical protein